MRSNVVLPQPDGPEQRDELALGDGEIDAAQHRGRAEGFLGAGDIEESVLCHPERSEGSMRLQSWIPRFARDDDGAG